MEQTVDIEEILESTKLDASTAKPDDAADKDPDTPEKKEKDDVPFNLDKGAQEINQHLVDALENTLTNPDLSVVMVHLLNPGLAVSRMQGDFLVNLKPWQHALVAFGLIFAVAVATNADLRDKLRRGVKNRNRRTVQATKAPKSAPKPPTSGDPIQ